MPTGPVNVLVVDDDRAIQRLVADALTQQGFSVTVERDGEWALKAFEMKDFDAVVLDLLLPLVNGYEVARKIRAMEKGKATPILMISGVYKNELHQREAVEHYGAFAFLEKPFKLSALQDALRQALGDRYPAPQAAPSIGEALEGAAQEEAARTEQLAAEEAKEEVRLVERTTRSPEPATTSIRGDFAQKPLPEVLAELHRWKASGALLIRRGTVKKIIYLRAGVPQFVKSNLLSECLGRVMVKERLLSQADCEESLRRMKASRRQQGTVLIEMGVISPNNLAHALNLQQRVKLFEVFGWSSGQYHFSPQKDLPPETINLDMTAAEIIGEGIKRTYDHDRVRAALGPCDGMFVHPADNPLEALQDLGLSEEEQLLLQAVDGRKSLDTLRALDLLSPLDTDRLIYAMRCAGVVTFQDGPAEKNPSISFKDIAQSGPHTVVPPPLPARREPGGGGAWSSLDGNMPTPLVPPPRHPMGEVETTSPTFQTADLLQNATSRSGPVSAPFVEISGSHSVSAQDEGLLRERLAARVAAMRKQDHYEILGVPTTARAEDIHESYLVLAREFHPDKLASSTSAEIRQLTEQIYNLVSLAHDTLMDPQERERYTADVSAGNVKREVGTDVSRILIAEGKFQRGEELLRQGAFAEAHAAFTEAVELYGDEGEFHAFKGWARYQMDPQKNGDEALKELERAIQLNPKSDRTYLFAGHIHKAAGRTHLAEQNFEKALQVNPSCAEALSELSLLTWAARLGGGKR